MRSGRAGVVLVFFVAACRRSSPPPPDEEAPEAGESEPRAEAADAAHRFQDAEPSVDVAARTDDAGAIDPACAADAMDLGAVVNDPRCAISSARARRLLADLQHDGGASRLVQDAKLGADGRVVLRLVNTGHDTLTLPISWSPKLAAISALAEDEKHALFELEPPKLDVPPNAEGNVHIARIVLAPGRFAIARFTPQTTIVKRIAPKCDDGGTCAPAKLPPGKYGLHVGQLVVDVEVGAPARVDWTVP
jgi:hypothetical protein